MDYSNVPAYLATDHEATVDLVVTAVAAASNPYTGLLAYDPDADLVEMADDLAELIAHIDVIDWEEIFPMIYAKAVELVDAYINPDDYVTARAAAHAALLDTDLAAKVYPKFEAGMRDINAIMTSAFVIGRANIAIDRNDKYDRFVADMELQIIKDRNNMINQAVSEMIRLFLQRVEFQRALAALQVDFYRIKIAAKADEATENKSIAAEAAKWGMSKYQYTANMIAALNGGTLSVPQSEGSKTARVMGSALSGASAGAMIGAAVLGQDSGGGIGAALGGLLGGIGSMLQ
jgi:hypothetical protein